MFVVMCESPEWVIVWLLRELFVSMDIRLGMVLPDIIDIPFLYLRHGFPNIKYL